LGLAQVDTECLAAVDKAAGLLESLGHTVVDDAPAALDDGTALETFGAVMMSSLRAELLAIEAEIGRPLTPEDMEPSTWTTWAAAGGPGRCAARRAALPGGCPHQARRPDGTVRAVGRPPPAVARVTGRSDGRHVPRRDRASRARTERRRVAARAGRRSDRPRR